MTRVDTDIDIDVANREHALTGLHHIPATVRDKHGVVSRHPSGVYFQPVPVNPLTGLCAYDKDAAAERGYFKIDLLPNKIYTEVRDEDHLDDLMAREPVWELFDDPLFVNELPHIWKHYGTVQSIRPRSIEDLAIVLALIRPGKKHLIGRAREEIDAEVWLPDDQGFRFKRAHAIAYAVSIVVKLNLMIEMMGADIDAGGSDV
jgi:hypothetical protein